MKSVINTLNDNQMVKAVGLAALAYYGWTLLAPKNQADANLEGAMASGFAGEREPLSPAFGIEPGEAIPVPLGGIFLAGPARPGAPPGRTVVLVPEGGSAATDPIQTPAGPAAPIQVEPGAEVQTTETGLEYILVQYPNGETGYVTVNSIPYLPQGTRIIAG